MRRLLCFVILALAALTAPTAAASLPKVFTQLNPAFQVRPAVISYTGDGTGIVGGSDGRSARYPGHLHWGRYNHTQGIARGVVWIDDCEPDCADGTFHPHKVYVHVYSASGGRFRKLTLSYSANGHHIVDRRKLRYFPPAYGIKGYWAWDIA